MAMSWAALARALLKEHDPRLFRTLKSSWVKDPETGERVTELNLYLKDKEREAQRAYATTLEQMIAEDPIHEAMHKVSAQEIVTKNHLDPRTW